MVEGNHPGSKAFTVAALIDYVLFLYICKAKITFSAPCISRLLINPERNNICQNKIAGFRITLFAGLQICIAQENNY